MPAHSGGTINVLSHLSFPSPGFADSLPSTPFSGACSIFLESIAPSKVPVCFKAPILCYFVGTLGTFLPSHSDFETALGAAVRDT